MRFRDETDKGKQIVSKEQAMTARKRDRWQPFTLDNAWIVEFPTKPAGVLRLGPGKLNLSARMSVCHRAEDNWYSVVACDVRLADHDGQLWQATSTFHSHHLLYPLIDLSRKQPARWLRKGPPEWRQALKSRALIRGLTATYDDRFWRCFWIDGTGIPLDFKYLGAVFDIAVLNESKLVVSVKNLFGSWNPVPLEGPDGRPLPVPPRRPAMSEEEAEEADERFQETGESGDYDHMPDLAYEIDAGKLLFRDTAEPIEGGYMALGMPRPPTFQCVRGIGEPQRAVSFLAGQNPASSPLPEQPEGPFVPLSWEAWSPFELLTDAGGFLRGEGKQSWQVCLEKAPGSEREPFDILRWRSRLADSAGDLWEGVAVFTPEVFLERLIDLDRTDLPAFAKEKAGKGVPGLRGIRGVLEDGAWRYAILADEVIAFQGTGQKLTIDVGLGGSEGQVQVRIAGLVGRRRPIEIDYFSPYVVLDPPERRVNRKRWEEDHPLPVVVYKADFLKLAFHNTSFAVDDGFWHGNAIPIPVVFRLIGKAEPAPAVQFLPS
jgi:hypothetical protein